MSPNRPRFRVAFSFSGAERAHVEAVAALLAERFGRDAILYDRYHEAEFSRGDLDVYLPRLYRAEAELVVMVVGPDYRDRPWTGLEWRAIRQLLTERKDDEVMLTRFGGATVEGLYGNGWLELDGRSPEDTQASILERLAINEGRPRDFYTSRPARVDPRGVAIPRPPALYAEPPYIGSHAFLGRRDQLETLDEWASPADPHPMLLFWAIGGSGKSLLTWSWTNRAKDPGRAGTFWYSFYERGGVLADFCRRALAYMLVRPVEELHKLRTPVLGDMLLAELKARPWLVVLDGLERILVSYHRHDAAQLADGDAGTADVIANRDPCAAIRPEDDELLRALTTAAPSKLLVTTRLVPRVLLNASGQPLPGVRSEALPGLRPADAEALFRACGIRGNGTAIQAYLKRHCDCHPLVIGVLAGLVNDFLPARGDFDAWEVDAEGGGRLDLAELDLVQKRNHILRAALDALSPESRQLLSTLALVSESVDYETLSALNPHLGPEPVEVPEPERPEEDPRWAKWSAGKREEARAAAEAARRDRAAWEAANATWERSKSAANRKLPGTVKDLERRGLLQYDPQSRRYDLHPVVRGVAAGGLANEDKTRFGQRVVDHFSRQAHHPYDQAETLDDLRAGMQVVRTLVQMGRFEEAASAYALDLGRALLFNLEAYAEVLGLLRPLFPDGWESRPRVEFLAGFLANDIATALRCSGEREAALTIHERQTAEDLRNPRRCSAAVNNAATTLAALRRPAAAERIARLAAAMADAAQYAEGAFASELSVYGLLVTRGAWPEADAQWSRLDAMGRDWPRYAYRPGNLERVRAHQQLLQGALTETDLASAESLSRSGHNRAVVRLLHALRAHWHLQHSRWAPAVESFAEAIRMARETGLTDATAEAGLALARFRLGTLADPARTAAALAAAPDRDEVLLATLFLAIGDHDRARVHALAAYREAWADGEPYVNRFALDRATALLHELAVPLPDLPAYDPVRDPPLRFEAAVIAAIEELRRENQGS